MLILLILLLPTILYYIQHLEDWISRSWDWLLSIGIREDYLHRSVHEGNKLAHYARACTDITFKFPFGTSELMGIAARGNYDLTQHALYSGKNMEYFDPIHNVKYIPHVIEPSIGVDRLFLALLCSAYKEEIVEGEKRIVLALHPSIAPIKVAILPLVGNKLEITSKAKEIYNTLQLHYNVEYDTSGAIGRRYRRADEAGTPYCVTVDYDSLSDHSVTVRERDSMEQIRMPVTELYSYLAKHINNFPC